MSLDSVLARYKANSVPPVPSGKTVGGTAVTPVVTGCSPCSTCSPTETRSETKNTPTDDQLKARKDKEPNHRSPKWIAARDAWHRHYFKCKTCQSYHRQKQLPGVQNPCQMGKLLHEMYKLAGSNET